MGRKGCVINREGGGLKGRTETSGGGDGVVMKGVKRGANESRD